MTELLQRIITELEQLPEDEQNAIASRFLAELEDEKAWKASFEATTDEQWQQMADQVRQEIKDSNKQKAGCLDDVIDLVDQWLAEDSEYDQEVYPQLEVALSNQPVSIQVKCKS